MRKSQVIFAGVVFILGRIFILHAQEVAVPVQVTASDLTVMLQAVEATTPLPASAAPDAGNFYSAQHSPSSEEPWPPLPADVLGLPVWQLGGGLFLLDDENVNYAALVQQYKTSGLMPMDSGFAPLVMTTNDLWLQIITVTNGTAALVIHSPWNVTNKMYDLLYCTNLDSPISWQWLLRSDPGQTNLVVPNATDAQGFYRLGPPDDLTANDSLGTNFWVTFIYVSHQSNPNLSLYISSPVGTTGTVTIPGFGITNTFSVAAGAVTNISITSGAMMSNYDYAQNYGINIIASQPVSVYGLYYQHVASACFTAYPTPLLGTNYCVMAYPAISGYRSQFGIVATADNTTVTITPSPTSDLLFHFGTNAYTETLQQGQTYPIASRNGSDDVTGTQITSDKPVGVFAGASAADVPVGVSYANPLVQEQLPVESWGTQTLALSFAGRTNGDSYRILSAQSNTVTISGVVVTISGSTITTNYEVVITNLIAGTPCDIVLKGPVTFQGSQPIQVAHFANGAGFDSNYIFANGDPCEILLVPTGHYLETNTIFTLPNDGVTGDFVVNYLNIVVAQSAITNTLVDGLAVTATNFMAIGSSGYYGAQIVVTTSGKHTVTSSQPVGVEVYGFGQADAYGYFGGVVK